MNALAAIEELVHRSRKLTFTELRDGIFANDAEAISACLKAPKWGNDDEFTGRLMKTVNSLRKEVCKRVAARHHLPAIPICHVVRSLHHIDGTNIGATPDGRKAGDPLADSIGAVCGTTTEGPTAILNSVLEIDSSAFLGVYNFDPYANHQCLML